jgi:hypothetical protein
MVLVVTILCTNERRDKSKVGYVFWFFIGGVAQVMVFWI